MRLRPGPSCPWRKASPTMPPNGASASRGSARPAPREGIGYDEELQIDHGERPTTFWVRTTVWRCATARGGSRASRAPLQDISERRVAEGRLRLSAAVFDNTSQGVQVITDTTPEIIAMNRAFTEINGSRRGGCRWAAIPTCSNGRHEQGFYAALWSDLLADRVTARGDRNRAQGRRDLAPQWVNINAVRSGASGITTHYVGVFSDLSDIKRSEAQIERLAHPTR